MSLNMAELSNLLRMGMRILPPPMTSHGTGSIMTTFISCSRFWMLFYAFWLLFMDMFFTIFPTTLIVISILTLILHYSRIPTPPNQFVHAVFGVDPNIVLNTEQDKDTGGSNWTSSLARQLATGVMDTAIYHGHKATDRLKGTDGNNLSIISGITGLAKTAVKNKLGKAADDGYATPTPDLILEQGIVSNKNYEVPVSVVGHRGASLDVPENCIGALEYCKQKGCHFVYLDVSMTRDKVAVLFHDEDLVRVAGINHRIKLLNWEQLRRVDVSKLRPHQNSKFGGRTIPSLDAAIDACIELNMKFFLNIVDYSEEMIEAICQTYRTRKAMYSMGVVTSFHWKAIYGIRKRDPKILGCLAFPLSEEGRTARFMQDSQLLQSGRGILEWGHQCYDNFLDWFLETFLWWYLGLSAIFIHKDGISKNEIKDWGSKGIRVFLWMVNSPEEKLYINKSLRVGYLTDTLVGDEVLHVHSKRGNLTSEVADAKKTSDRKSKVEPTVQKSSDSLSSDLSMHSIPPSPEEDIFGSGYFQNMLTKAAGKLQKGKDETLQSWLQPNITGTDKKTKKSDKKSK